MFYNSIKRGKKIITVSKFSKEEIEKWYKIKNVEVVCNSFEHINSIQEDKSILSKFNLKVENIILHQNSAKIKI